VDAQGSFDDRLQRLESSRRQRLGRNGATLFAAAPAPPLHHISALAAQTLNDQTLVEEPPTHRERPGRASGPLVYGERYTIGDVIGRGGMGEVCTAYDVQVGREVAIKRLLTDAPSHAQLARFLREARIQGRLQHPAIPPVHEIGFDGHGRPYFVMARLGGATLAEVLRAPYEHAGFTRRRLLDAFVEICHAIEVAHVSGVAHLDLKPSNVLLGNRGETYVLDWGVARELDRPSAEPGIALGTPAYMAPEQLCGADDLDGRADVYALGCVLFEILTGEQRRPGEPLRSDTIPPELEHVCLEATAPVRDERLASARALSEAVQRYLDGDRDLERRRELAARHLDNARAALASVPDEERRHRDAMRQAGRAIALDPTLADAAELVGGLMLSPPAKMPAAVERELASLDRTADRRQLRRMIAINVAQLAMLPLMFAFGVRDVPYLAALIVFGVLNIGSQIGSMLSERFMRYTAPLAMVLALGMFAVLARAFTPFLCAPAYAAVSLMSFGMSSMARQRRVIVTCAVLSIAVVLGVFGAEVIGLLSRTTWVVGDTLVMRSPLDGIQRFPIIPALCEFVVLLIGSAASIAHAVSCIHHRAREQLQIQSWQLRQLL
jgi:serine/threonine protein kinase